jgi:photosystem II stability/assembly factor-like uncharacterized protein
LKLLLTLWAGCWFVVLLVSCATPEKIASRTPPTVLPWQALNRGLTPHSPVMALVANPQNPQQVLAGVYAREALYASDDGGSTWHVQGDSLSGHPVFTLLVDPDRTDTVWAGTADGLYRARWPSARQQAWQRVAPWPLATPVFALHAAQGRLYAAGGHPAIWTTTNGAEWQALTPLRDAPSAVLTVAVAANGVLLAGSDGAGLFLSRDQGQSWQRVPEIEETFVASLWVAPWDDRLILARTRAGLFRSTDGAVTWQLAGEQVEDRVDAIASLHQADEQAILLGMSSGQIFRSTDQGTTWQRWGEGVGRDGLFPTLWIASDSLPTFWAGTQHGLYQSQDGGQRWQLVPSVGTFRATALAQASDGRLYLGNEDGVAVSQNQGESWQASSAGLPARTVLALVVSPHDPDTVYAATEGDGIYISHNGGAQWQPWAWAGSTISELVLDPHHPGRFYVRVAYERVYVSDDEGRTWSARWEGMTTTTEILSLAISPHQPDLLYAGGSVDAFKSTDGGQHWQTIGSELAGQSLFSLAVDAHQPASVYAGATKGLYRSQDAGATWRLWGSGLADRTVTTLAFHPTQPNFVYAGTKYQGIYVSTDGGQHWQPAQSGMSQASVYRLLVDQDRRWLYAATDQGFWRAPLVNPLCGRAADPACFPSP